MFDLNRAISNWRNELAATGRLSSADIDELESHLRQQVDNFSGGQVTEEEAFMVAARRLGHGDDLAGEFAKVNGARIRATRFFWMIVGVFAYLAVNSLVGVAGGMITFVGAQAGFAPRHLGLADALARAIILFGTLIIVLISCGVDIRGHGDNIMGGQITRTLLRILIVLVPVLFVARWFTPSLAVRVMGASQYGEMARVSAAFSIALSVIFYAAMAGLMVWLRKRAVA